MKNLQLLEVFGGLIAGATKGVGNWAETGNLLLKKLRGHSLFQGSISTLQGANFKHGFLSGLVSADGGYGMTKSGIKNKVLLVLADSTIEGTTTSQQDIIPLIKVTLSN